MNRDQEIIRVPRNVPIRWILRTAGRFLVKVFFDLEIIGKKNFPADGPLIIVGNHSAIMEAVLLIVYSPWQIEMLGAADIPHEKISQIFSDLYGFIPVNRGHIDRPALRSALSVLDQRGVIGIFPEGGIWEPGLMRAQTGVAWLSYRSNTPVLPVGFSGTMASLGRALRLKKPKLVMNIGKLIQPLELNTGMPRKMVFEYFSERIMSKVRNLILQDDPSLKENIQNERFELTIVVTDDKDNIQQHPSEIKILHAKSIAKLLHRPTILKIFRSNLQLPIDPLENLDANENPCMLKIAVDSIVGYLENENPYLLTYRFGPKTAENMFLGLKELQSLLLWACHQNFRVKIAPIRKFYSNLEKREITQYKQGKFEGWM